MSLLSDLLVPATGTGGRARELPTLSGGAREGRGSGLYPAQPHSTKLVAGP